MPCYAHPLPVGIGRMEIGHQYLTFKRQASRRLLFATYLTCIPGPAPHHHTPLSRHRGMPLQRYHCPSTCFITVRSPHRLPSMCFTTVRVPHLVLPREYQCHLHSSCGIQQRQQQVFQSSSCHSCSPGRSFRCHSGCCGPARYPLQHGCLHRAVQLACPWTRHLLETGTSSPGHAPGGHALVPATAAAATVRLVSPTAMAKLRRAFDVMRPSKTMAASMRSWHNAQAQSN